MRGVERAGTLHLPDGAPRGAVLVLHGFGGHPDQPHIVETCATLAASGVAAYRFPYRDHEPPRMTYRSALEDAEQAVRAVRARPGLEVGALAVVGFSFGGTIAALLAGREAAVRAAVIAAGPARPGAWLDRPVDPRDWPDPVAAVAATKARVLLLWGTRDDQVPLEHARTYARALAAANVPHELATIEGADHDFGPAATRAEMARRVAEWVAGSR